MKDNVILLKREERPNDLVKLTEISKDREIGYHFLYKYSVRAYKKGQPCIRPYYEGGVKVSLSEMEKFLRDMEIKKWRG